MILDVRFEELNVSFETSFDERDTFFITEIQESNVTFETDFGEVTQIYEDYPSYTGEYGATPKVVAQTLPTAQKFLSQNVTIAKIPYFEVSNTSGGDTVYIGNEV